MSHELRTRARVVVESGDDWTRALVVGGIDYTDGYRVTVGWSEDDDAWIARLTGCAPEPNIIGDGRSREEALLSLCCALASLADCLHDELTGGHPAPSTGETE